MTKAVEYFKKAADLGSIEALGALYEYYSKIEVDAYKAYFNIYVMNEIRKKNERDFNTIYCPPCCSHKDDDTIKKIYDTLTYDEKILADEKIKKMLGKIDRIDKTELELLQ